MNDQIDIFVKGHGLTDAQCEFISMVRNQPALPDLCVEDVTESCHMLCTIIGGSKEDDGIVYHYHSTENKYYKAGEKTN